MVGARQFDEKEVVAIAIDVFWRKGLHDATMQDLATATGVQRGSLYNAYGDKEGDLSPRLRSVRRAVPGNGGQSTDTGRSEGRTSQVLRCDHREYDKRLSSARLLDNAHRARCGYFEPGRAPARAKSAQPA